MDTMFQSGDADEDINQKAEDKTPTRRIGHEMLDVARTTSHTKNWWEINNGSNLQNIKIT